MPATDGWHARATQSLATSGQVLGHSLRYAHTQHRHGRAEPGRSPGGGNSAAIHDEFPLALRLVRAAADTESDARQLMFDRWAKTPCVYIMASKRDGVIYLGVTSDLFGRIAIHKQDLVDGFTKKYGVHRLVYYEMHDTMQQAIMRETQLKKWKRAWKVRLIHEMNPEWFDLFDEHNGGILDGPVDRARPGR